MMKIDFYMELQKAFAIYDKTFNVDALSNRELMFEANEPYS